MNVLFVTLILVVVVALIFDYINGFHDTANAIATVVSTGVLPIRTAVLISACLNFGGALLGTAVASTIGKGLIAPAAVTQVVVLSALVGAITWNLVTWYFGIPSSSSHALVGGLVGAGIAHAGSNAVQAAGLLKVIKSLILSPLAGFGLAFFMMIAILWIAKDARPARINRIFRRLQMVSAGFMALSHGSNDAQKTMGIITMSLVAYGAIPRDGDKFAVPLWVVLACAAAMAAGTAAGGVRIIKTMGTKIIRITPLQGFAAETAGAATILTASHFGVPVSTTHCINASIMGVGASKRISAVRWGVASNILVAWVLTLPAAALMAFLTVRALMLLGI
jgi:PiT family inorganic phosphate transporter